MNKFNHSTNNTKIVKDNDNQRFNWNEFQKKFMKDKQCKDLIKYTLNEKNKEITSNHILNKLRLYGLNEDEYPSINDLKLYRIATTHESYTLDFQPKNETDKNFKKLFMHINYMNGESLLPIKDKDVTLAIKLKEDSYERLEYVGDAIIRMILSLYLFCRFPNDYEGFLSKLRAELENATTLSILSKKIDLQKYVLLSRNHEIFGSRDNNQKMQCDLFEAFIGALFLDVCKIKHDEISTSKIDLEYLMLKQQNGFGVCYKFVVNILEKETNIPKILKNNTNDKHKVLPTR